MVSGPAPSTPSKDDAKPTPPEPSPPKPPSSSRKRTTSASSGRKSPSRDKPQPVDKPKSRDRSPSRDKPKPRRRDKSATVSSRGSRDTTETAVTPSDDVDVNHHPTRVPSDRTLYTVEASDTAMVPQIL